MILVVVFLLLGPGLIPAGPEPFSVSPTLLASNMSGIVLSVTFSIPDHHYLYADQIDIQPEGNVELVPRHIPETKQKHDTFTDTIVGVYEHDTTFTYLVKGSTNGSVKIQVQYQGCSENICFLPVTERFSLTLQDQMPAVSKPVFSTRADGWTELQHESPLISSRRFNLAGRVTGYLQPKKFIKFLDRAEAGHGFDENILRHTFQEKGLWISAILIVLGGLALNLTPCVLPMIPINLAIIGTGVQSTLTDSPSSMGQATSTCSLLRRGFRRRSFGTMARQDGGQAGRAAFRWRGFALGGTYGSGIALVYGILGLVAIRTGARFGTLNSSPWFNMAVAIIFLLMALAMFGVFNIDFTRFQSRISTHKLKRGNYLAVFMLGGIVALLAGACVAPVVISVLLLSADLYARGNAAGLFLPFLLGIGMGLPWPFAGAGLSFLPKPGRWMVIIKYGFGAIILLFTLWYMRLGFSLLSTRTQSSRDAVVTAQTRKIEEGWMISLDEALTLAEQEGKPVFVDFWASWCKSCLKMEKTTFKDPDVRRRLESYVKIKYRAEDPGDDAVKAVLDHFKIIGLPTYVVLVPRERE